MAASDFNTQIYQNQPNPLQTAGEYAGFMNQMNQNRLFQQQFQTNLALSKIYQEAIDPQTGQIDMNKVRAMAAQNPSVTLGLPQAVQGSQAMQQQQLQIQGEQADLAKKQFGLWSDAIQGLMQKPNPTQKDVLKAAGSLVGSGVFSAPQVIGRLTDPNDPLPAGGPELKDWIQRHSVQGMADAQRYQYLFGNVMPINRGSTTVLAHPSPGGGLGYIGEIQNTMSPGEAATQTQVWDPATNQYRMVTKAQAAEMENGGGGGPMGAQGVPGNGRYPGGASVAGPAAAPTGGVGIPAAPPLGTPEAAAAVGTGSGNMYNNLLSDVQGTGARIFTLNKALTGLENSPTGPGSETWNNMKSFLLAQDPSGLAKLGIDPNKIKSYDEAQKYLTQYAIAQASSLGQDTDKKLATALTGNASTHISNLAAKDVVKANIGLERMKQAEATAFENSGLGPEAFSKWTTGWNKTVDPRAYMLDLIPAKDRAKMIAGMKPTEKAKFLQSVKDAFASGMFTPADLADAK